MTIDEVVFIIRCAVIVGVFITFFFAMIKVGDMFGDGRL